MPFFCQKRHETMDEACADCADCPGSGEDLKLNSFRTGIRNAMKLEDVVDWAQKLL